MALLDLMEKTGYNMVQVNGQRMYGGPPPGWEGPPHPRLEVFVGKIPRDMYEDELARCSREPAADYFNVVQRGRVGVVVQRSGSESHPVFDNHEIRPGKFLGVCMSRNNCRLFIGSIPKDKKKEEIMEEMKTVRTPPTNTRTTTLKEREINL
ncbi:putative RNA-binding protein 46 Cancer/testis antigen 68 [Larimichthys crocea]|uniref:Putative RNA-binding protein 46 Cancer/testis antigen 68 n=1 Tax=Larimichthys crocea TaxID=215358 RepID=A0A6G0HJT7_LARCR|nr:putative RNA-binding protein 46 Cancer/testis antigen 68 [Larimichthys crocea]